MAFALGCQAMLAQSILWFYVTLGQATITHAAAAILLATDVFGIGVTVVIKQLQNEYNVMAY